MRMLLVVLRQHQFKKWKRNQLTSTHHLETRYQLLTVLHVTVVLQERTDINGRCFCTECCWMRCIIYKEEYALRATKQQQPAEEQTYPETNLPLRSLSNQCWLSIIFKFRLFPLSSYPVTAQCCQLDGYCERVTTGDPELLQICLLGPSDSISQSISL